MGSKLSHRRLHQKQRDPLELLAEMEGLKIEQPARFNRAAAKGERKRWEDEEEN